MARGFLIFAKHTDTGLTFGFLMCSPTPTPPPNPTAAFSLSLSLSRIPLPTPYRVQTRSGSSCCATWTSSVAVQWTALRRGGGRGISYEALSFSPWGFIDRGEGRAAPVGRRLTHYRWSKVLKSVLHFSLTSSDSAAQFRGVGPQRAQRRRLPSARRRRGGGARCIDQGRSQCFVQGCISI